MTENKKLEQMEATTGWFKKAHKWIKSILTINQRLKQLEDIHFGDSPHPADICPHCGKHAVRYEIRRCDEHYITDNHYTHKQTKWAICSACGYDEAGESRECHTDKPVTDTPIKIDWAAAVRAIERKTSHF